ncbi:MAG: DUF4388 domain-containing protein [Deltaproteobacteria bacterium]|nr:DUF4388 domain-containing protein [Deltaproteobacteria bacterium]MBW2070876.1 DUF4388 domain-containing protein [Deltaproteobacteria bacterium]
MAFTGDLKSLNLSTVLQILSSEGKTGILEIARKEAKAAIYLKNGTIIAASSGLKELRLGELLLERGVISRQQLREVVAQAGRTARPVGEVLLAFGYVDEESLKRIVRYQVRETVLNIFLWEEGRFEFRESHVDFDERVFDEINTMEIILEAARRMDEWAVIKKVIPSDTMVFEIKHQPGTENEKVTLEPRELKVASLMDGSRSVRDLVKMTGISEFEIYKILYAMASSKLIRPLPSAASEKGRREAEEPIRLLPIYHDVVVTISKHVEEELGPEYSTRLISSCRASLPVESKEVLAGYQVGDSGHENVSRALQVASRRHKGEAAERIISAAFMQLITCLLQQETEILGSRQTMHSIARIQELLQVVERYHSSDSRSRLISSLRTSLSQIAATLQGQ